MSLGQKKTDLEFPNVEHAVGGYEDDEGINAFNTEDVLKQDVNPTHAVNPSVFGSELHKFDMNSSRTLRERHNKEYNFSTPITRADRANEYD